MPLDSWEIKFAINELLTTNTRILFLLHSKNIVVTSSSSYATSLYGSFITGKILLRS